MKRKLIRDWENFVDTSTEFLAENMQKVYWKLYDIIKSRVTLKYRNKAPSNGKLYATDDNKSFRYKFTEKNDLDKLDSYIKSLLHVMTNIPLDAINTQMDVDGMLIILNFSD